MSLLDRLLGLPDRDGGRARDDAADQGDGDAGDEALVFVCSQCGRTDLPETGGWDPPICEECDAAINFDSLY